MSIFKFKPTPLLDAIVVECNSFLDERGSFSRFFCNTELATVLEKREIVNINFSQNNIKGTLRGMHTQKIPSAELKFVRCTRGRIYDVIVDLRKGSPSFLKSFGVELSAENKKMLIVPEGFGHGFQTLEDDSDLLYATTAAYDKYSELAFNYADPLFNITWPLPVNVISDKDSAATFIKSDFIGL